MNFDPIKEIGSKVGGGDSFESGHALCCECTVINFCKLIKTFALYSMSDSIDYAQNNTMWKPILDQ